jgi:hypothetical protein
MSWSNADSFSRGLLAGFGFIDTLNQRKNQQKLQQRALDNQERAFGEDIRRYDESRERADRAEQFQRDDYNYRTGLTQVAQAQQLKGNEAYRLGASVGFDMDKLPQAERDFALESAPYSQQLMAELGSRSEDLRARSRFMFELQQREAAAKRARDQQLDEQMGAFQALGLVAPDGALAAAAPPPPAALARRPEEDVNQPMLPFGQTMPARPEWQPPAADLSAPANAWASAVSSNPVNAMSISPPSCNSFSSAASSLSSTSAYSASWLSAIMCAHSSASVVKSW